MTANHNIPNTAPVTSDEIHIPATEKEASRTNPIEEAHERFGIDPNTPEIVQRTIESNGFTALELEQPYTLPTIEEWVAQRLAQGYSGYNYGSFVINEAEQIGFAKTHYGPANIQTIIGDGGEVTRFEVGGPEREAMVLEALGSNGYEAPEVLGYSPASPEDTPPEEKMYELLVIEAVLPEYGSVRERQAWTPQLARISAQKIATFAKPTTEIPLFENESISLSVEGLIEMLPRSGGEYDTALYKTLESYTHLDEPIVVHGDTWFNNIIARHDDSDLLFVDWELAGPGYQGQDAGRKLWDLTLADDWSFAEYGEAAQAFTEEWCKTDDDRNSLAFGIMYESLRWISERIRDIEAATDEATRISLTQEIEEIKSHALAVLHNVTEKSMQ